MSKRLIMKLISCLAALAITLTAFNVSASSIIAASNLQVNPDLSKKLDQMLTRYSEYGLSGSFLVAKDNQIILQKGYGLADRDRKVSNTQGTLFEMGSITKTFTAAAILKLEMARKLSVHDPISKYLGEFPKPKAGATIFHLLAHKAGLIVEGANLPSGGKDRDRFVQDMKETPVETAPGEQYRYTNAGFSVLAAIIEKVSGQSYEAFVREQLLKPAGMSNSGFRGDFSPDDPRIAHGYLGTPEKVEEGPALTYLWGTRGAGGLIATVGDLYKWHLALQTNQILSESARKKMFALAPTEQYGWHVETTKRGTPLIHKGGGQVNFASHILYYPTERLVIIFATNNLQQRWRRVLVTNITNASLGESYLLPEAPISLTSTELKRFEGAYVTPAGDAVLINATADYLYLTGKGASSVASVPLLPLSLTMFGGVDTATNKLVSLSFQFDSKSQIKAVVLSSSTGDLALHRTN
jgi:CubicO group peptidase (beta-lactamase class C family)